MTPQAAPLSHTDFVKRTVAFLRTRGSLAVGLRPAAFSFADVIGIRPGHNLLVRLTAPYTLKATALRLWQMPAVRVALQSGFVVETWTWCSLDGDMLGEPRRLVVRPPGAIR